jgi:Papain fold toxin 2
MELCQQITQIASCFKLFECVDCAEAIKEFLIQRRIPGKQIKLYTGRAKGKYGNIYHDGLQRNIATNGRHEGILIEIAGEEIVFDNIHPEGITREAWMANLYCLAMDLGGGFEITVIEF